MSNQLTIAIDGFSSSGKSTLAKNLAKSLGYVYIDSGAMYRAVALYFLQNDIDFTNPTEVTDALCNISIEIKREATQRILLNDTDVTEQIREMRVNAIVSEVAAISPVRSFLVKQQKAFGKKGGIVMDGRDIGTVVFPNADLKIYVTTDINVRAKRRFDELQVRGIPAKDIDEVKVNLAHRDHIDSTRADSPLTKANDAKVLDNTYLSREEQLEIVIAWAEELIN